MSHRITHPQPPLERSSGSWRWHCPACGHRGPYWKTRGMARLSYSIHETIHKP